MSCASECNDAYFAAKTAENNRFVTEFDACQTDTCRAQAIAKHNANSAAIYDTWLNCTEACNIASPPGGEA